MVLMSKLSLHRSSLQRGTLAPCLPTAKRLSRGRVPAGPGWWAACRGWAPGQASPRRTCPARAGITPPDMPCSGRTCPPPDPKTGHHPNMSSSRAQGWTCPIGLGAPRMSMSSPAQARTMDMPHGARCVHGTCPPPARTGGHTPLSTPAQVRSLGMSPAATFDHGTCPLLARISGHTPLVPIPEPDDWTCPPLLNMTKGHALGWPAQLHMSPVGSG
jgi:hypothetical protein